jgi:hypothetical protein
LHQLEVITGTGRRRRFSDDDKARITEGTLSPGAVVSEIARRHGYRRNRCLAGAAKARQPASASSAGSFFVQTFFDCLPGAWPDTGRTCFLREERGRIAPAAALKLSGKLLNRNFLLSRFTPAGEYRRRIHLRRTPPRSDSPG